MNEVNSFEMVDLKQPLYRPSKYRPGRVKGRLPLFFEPKLDGKWIRVTNMGTGKIRAHSHHLSTREMRYGYADTPEEVIRDIWLRGSTLPRRFCLDGELVWPGHTQPEVATALKECPDKLEYTVHTIPFWDLDCTEITYSYGRRFFERVIDDRFPLIRVPNPNTWIKEAPSILDLQALLDVYRKEYGHVEGFVLKHGWYSHWWKYKDADTAYLQYVGHSLGVAGKWKGKPNAILVADAANVGLGFVGTGFDDSERRSILSHDVGCVVEIAYDNISDNNRLIRPRFVAWRPDLTFDVVANYASLKE